MIENSFDPLYHIFEHELFHCDHNIDKESFVARVFEVYIQHLVEKNAIPHYYLKNIASDIEEEIRQILNKKTYGYTNIGSYLKFHKASNKDK